MTPELTARLEALREAREKATQGEWFGDPAPYLRGQRGAYRENNGNFVLAAANDALPLMEDMAKEIERLEAKNVRMVEACNKYRHWIFQNSQDWQGDWACVQCKPYSDMLVKDFVCAVHQAKAAHAAFDAEEG